MTMTVRARAVAAAVAITAGLVLPLTVAAGASAASRRPADAAPSTNQRLMPPECWAALRSADNVMRDARSGFREAVIVIEAQSTALHIAADVLQSALGATSADVRRINAQTAKVRASNDRMSRILADTRKHSAAYKRNAAECREIAE